MSLLSASGSSPLTRGKRSEVNCGFLSERLIPAHAGKTTWVTLRCWRDLAHPRSRGENKLIWSPLSPQRGSSPLTRGKRLREQAQQARHGLIPAHAGKTTRGPSVPTGRPAHPRSRGENSPQKRRSPGWAGSSPLTRGKLSPEEEVARLGGLIPAHAGKTFSIASRMICRRAHPRSRGENAKCRWPTSRARGSSPLTRGKRAYDGHAAALGGLIPAHAGKTWRSSCQSCWWGAHPRSRGENGSARYAHRRRGGSSPLTRGKRAGMYRRSGSRGLIPAHAGKTRRLPARA